MPEDKFQRIAKTCPWRKLAPGFDYGYCSGSEEATTMMNKKICNQTNCAPFHFVILNENQG